MTKPDTPESNDEPRPSEDLIPACRVAAISESIRRLGPEYIEAFSQMQNDAADANTWKAWAGRLLDKLDSYVPQMDISMQRATIEYAIAVRDERIRQLEVLLQLADG